MKISVVIPTYNEERGIGKFLQQFEYQTMPRNEFEIIVVDGNSNDTTREIAKEYADVVLIQKSKGIGGARNDGIEIAKAEVIITTDADVIFAPFWLEKIYNCFENDLNLKLLFGPLYFKTQSKMISFLSRLKHMINQVFARFRIAYFATGPNTAFRKKIFLEVGGYSDLPFMDDFELTSRMQKLGKIVYDRTIYVYTSARRIEKLGINRAAFLLISNYFRYVLFGKEGIWIKDYAKQEYLL